MKPEQYYSSDELLSRGVKNKLWQVISASTQSSPTPFSIRDGRSFLYGMAASLLILLSGFGLVHIVERLTEADQPAELRFDEAYQSAIREFEEILPAVAQIRDTDRGQAMLEARRQQIALLDAAIRELRNDIARTDLSPLKRVRLRQLYMLKLKALLEIIEQGDIEL